MSRVCFASLILLMAMANLTAWPRGVQDNLAQGPRLEVMPTPCETHIAVLDIADQDAGPNGLIIVIARLGDGERSRRLNQHRLHSARAYLPEYREVRLPETVVTAEGDRVAGYGRIELYIAGKLHTAFAIKQNAELSVGSCEPPELDDGRQRVGQKAVPVAILEF